ncbi:SepM family pheromone-processing serine protease [Metabacillus malikii]|uniref:endopeptidase La n=1 Tax=Metabacillus malikii TaxID=1504265 RepID=A0ABT9ZIC9_9BACI|nr:SepM family pheromone-processing serine protease [Metabacillus malikii]MDQ0231288.1 PDZ domain-containing protein [Metabacillus malikii]
MRSKIALRTTIVVLALVIILSFIKLPYYVTKPGMAFELGPIIEVETGYQEVGSFSLTTVRIGRANPITYLWALLKEYHYILPITEMKNKNETDDDYYKRQLTSMENSKESAISIAYKKANKKISALFNGIYVNAISENMPADGKLKVGDRIIKIDNFEFQSVEEFMQYIENKELGNEVEIHYEREGKQKQVTLKLAAFPNDPSKIGIGISLLPDKELLVKPDIKINTEEIGGPSAGLMMALEIYNQLIKEDITKGYKIAGTGTISADGKIGPIGGISQKIVAADKEGIEIFFAPHEESNSSSNYQEAIKVAKKINTKMKVVPVSSFDDAVKYLTSLQQKKNAK